MPFLCTKCWTEAEDSECEYCGGVTRWVSDVYELKVRHSCDFCGASVTKTMDYYNKCSSVADQEYLFGNMQVMYCPHCESEQLCTTEIVTAKMKIDASSYLNKAYKEEFDQGFQRRKKKQRRDY